MNIFDFVFKFGASLDGLWIALQSVIGWSVTIAGVNIGFWSIFGGGALLAIIGLVVAKAITPFL
ncbi:MAG: hypothetical protein RSB20_06645 [Clostridia bacterium]